MNKQAPIWTPGCGRPHPDIELIRAWAEGKITLIGKQRMSVDGKKHGEALKVQYPCWNVNEWKFDVAQNSQMVLDLGETLVSTRRIKAPVKKEKKLMGYEDFSVLRDPIGLALG